MTPDLIRRHEATRHTMNRFRKRKFSWHDEITCVHLARFHLRQMGHRTPALPRVRSPDAAVAAMAERGWANTTEMLDSLKQIRRIAPAMMLMGDLAVLEGTEEAGPLGSIVICAQPPKVFGWREDCPQLVVLDIGLDQVKAAWRL